MNKLRIKYLLRCTFFDLVLYALVYFGVVCPHHGIHNVLMFYLWLSAILTMLHAFLVRSFVREDRMAFYQKRMWRKVFAEAEFLANLLFIGAAAYYGAFWVAGLLAFRLFFANGTWAVINDELEKGGVANASR